MNFFRIIRDMWSTLCFMYEVQFLYEAGIIKNDSEVIMYKKLKSLRGRR